MTRTARLYSSLSLSSSLSLISSAWLRLPLQLALLLSLAAVNAQCAAAQNSMPQSAQPASATAATPASPPPVLEALQATAQSTSSDVERLRIEKWKADGGTKQQAQQMASSVTRNLRSALPELIQAASSQPASMAAQFKLYHNLTALYETLASLAETAGAFGARQEYDALSSDANRLDEQRRLLAENVQSLASRDDSELTQFRTQAARAAAAAAAAPPKKIIVDDDSPPAKTSAAKKKSKKPAPPPAQQPPE